MNVAFFLFMEVSCFLLFVFLSSLVCLRRASPNMVARDQIITILISGYHASYYSTTTAIVSGACTVVVLSC